MIEHEFGQLSASMLSAAELLRRFNALQGSNTRPRLQIKSIVKNALDYDMSEENVYLDKLTYVQASEFESPMVDAPAGSVLFDFRQSKGNMFIKCADGDYVSFTQITTSRFSKAKAGAFSQKAMGGHCIAKIDG